jgi:hypothetical protein
MGKKTSRISINITHGTNYFLRYTKVGFSGIFQIIKKQKTLFLKIRIERV